MAAPRKNATPPPAALPRWLAMVMLGVGALVSIASGVALLRGWSARVDQVEHGAQLAIQHDPVVVLVPKLSEQTIQQQHNLEALNEAINAIQQQTTNAAEVEKRLAEDRQRLCAAGQISTTQCGLYGFPVPPPPDRPEK